MRVLVTGGSGFIGSHVVDQLRAQGHEPVIFDLVDSPYHEPGEIRTVIGDLEDHDSVRAAVAGCDVVTHLAAVSDVNIVVDDPTKASAINVGGTAAVLEAARAEGVRRVVYASTVWVYGGADGVEPLDEDTQLALPDHLYTATKLAGEMYCRSYAELYGLEYTVLRFGIPYGPRSRRRPRTAPTTSSVRRVSRSARSPRPFARSSRTSRSCTWTAGRPTSAR